MPGQDRPFSVRISFVGREPREPAETICFISDSVEKRLREQRVHLGISQEALAEDLSVSVRSIRQWEQDQAVPQEIGEELFSTAQKS
jgi:DNA-binding transcriptional regulator YiaG